ncbi:YcfL family protein [Isoalcanivorax beigongshangi]|uniref:YcfL family protein n=1 Tax=Isoalcanivorax beigongshangi TaxID=3238810 RepID=A0ABV4AME8_9GAMM
MKRYALLPLVLGALLTAGCANKPVEEPLAVEDVASVRYETSSLSNKFEIDNVQRALAGNVLRAQVTLRNKSSFTVSYQYKFRWYDANGFEIQQQGEPWRPQVVAGKGETRLQGLAPNPAAARFEVWLRAE